MQELQLSDDLNVITAEINSYKQVAGQAIFEIGKRLKHVKENDLAYGEWGDWIESINLSRGQATKFITVYEELDSDDSTWNNLGTQALYLVATLPEQEREKQHDLPSGEKKAVDEMTVKELREVKKRLKQTEQELEDERNKEPERIEVVPDDYDYIKGNFEAAQNMRDRYKEQLEEMRKELNDNPKKDSSELEKLEVKERDLKSKINSYETLFDIQSSLEVVISSISAKSHALRTDEISGEYQIIAHFESTLDEVMSMCRQLKEKLPDKNIIEGEIIDE